MSHFENSTTPTNHFLAPLLIVLWRKRYTGMISFSKENILLVWGGNEWNGQCYVGINGISAFKSELKMTSKQSPSVVTTEQTTEEEACPSIDLRWTLHKTIKALVMCLPAFTNNAERLRLTVSLTQPIPAQYRPPQRIYVHCLRPPTSWGWRSLSSLPSK